MQLYALQSSVHVRDHAHDGFLDPCHTLGHKLSALLIREHLDECAPCLREFGLDQEVKALVARSCGCDVVPEGLRDRVLLRLQTVRVEIDHIEFRAD